MEENPYKAPVDAGGVQKGAAEAWVSQVRIPMRIGAVLCLLMAMLTAWRPDFPVRPRRFWALKSIADCQRLDWNLVAVCGAAYHCLTITVFVTWAWGLASDSRRVIALAFLFSFVWFVVTFALDFSVIRLG